MCLAYFIKFIYPYKWFGKQIAMFHIFYISLDLLQIELNTTSESFIFYEVKLLKLEVYFSFNFCWKIAESTVNNVAFIYFSCHAFKVAEGYFF